MTTSTPKHVVAVVGGATAGAEAAAMLADRGVVVRVTSHVIESYLGLGNGRHEGEERVLAPTTSAADVAATRLLATLRRKPALAPDAVAALLARVHARREAVGFTSSYGEWLERVTPPDLA
jgi:hypothetical protein